ncbi:MAG: EVE domain-containing protein [Candidatus Babeliaceae bacterium]
MKYWIAVASREHVLIGKKEGVVQVCHGKQNPLKRMNPGDWVIYYSPTEMFGQKEPCCKFTAIGQIKNIEPYQFKMSDNFIPWRRDVNFRYGLFSIPFDDFKLIVLNMGIDIHE